MGDRANIYLIDTDDKTRGIYLYTHWSGSAWGARLREALAKGRDRWGDPQYLARIITSHVFSDLTGNTGGGISTHIGDNGHDIWVCDLTQDTVARATEGSEGDPEAWRLAMSFEDYINLKS